MDIDNFMKNLDSTKPISKVDILQAFVKTNPEVFKLVVEKKEPFLDDDVVSHILLKNDKPVYTYTVIGKETEYVRIV